MEIHLPRPLSLLVGWSVRLLLLLLVVGIPVGLYVVDEHGLGRHFATRLQEELAKVGLEATVGKVAFDLARGLEARDVVVASKRYPGRTLGIVSELSVSLSLSDLVRGKLRIEELRTRGTHLAIPIGETTVEITDLNATLLFPPDQIRLQNATGKLFGIDISASAHLLNPNAVEIAPSGRGADLDAIGHQLAQVQKVLSEIEFARPEPTLHFEVEGDLADFQTLRVEPITLRAGAFRFRELQGEGAEFNARYAERRIEIDELSISGPPGTAFLLSASCDLNKRLLTFDLSNSVDLAPLLGELLPPDLVAEVSIRSGPFLEVSGTASLEGEQLSGHVSGSFSVGGIEARGIRMDTVKSDFAWRDGAVYLLGLEARRGDEKVTADVWHQEADFRVRGESTLLPSTIAPVLSARDREVVSRLEFEDLPTIRADLSGSRPNLDHLSGTGSIRLGRTAFQGGWLDSATAKVELSDRVLTYSDLEVRRPEGRGSGTFVYDFGRGQVGFRDFRSTMMPVEVLKWAGPQIQQAATPYRFTTPPSATLNGTVAMRDPDATALTVDFSATGPIRYELLGKSLTFDDASGRLQVKGRDIFVRLPELSIYGGKANFQIDVLQTASPKIYRARVSGSGVDFESLTGLYFGYRESEGKLSGQFDWKSPLQDSEALIGSGEVRVRDGNVFAIPIFGPLSVVMNEIIPGAGYQNARNATASFTIEDGTLNTQDLEVDGRGFGMFGEGDLYLFRDQMDFSMRINAKGVPGIILFPVSKVFEYVSDGTMSDPKWRPKIVPKGFLDVGEGVQGVGESIGDGLQGIGDGVQGIGTGIGRGIRGLGDGLQQGIGKGLQGILAPRAGPSPSPSPSR